MTNQYTTFYLGDAYLGIDVLRVREILVRQNMTPVPMSPKSVLGLINLRGQIVTAVDLRDRMGMTGIEEVEEPMNVVIRTNEGPVSLMVDAVGDVITVSDKTLEPTPDNVSGPARRFVSGVHKLDGKLLAVLDVDRLFPSDPQSMAS